MSTTTFKIIYNLEGLDDAAIERYKADVSNYFGLDPAVNWFDVLWMTDPDTGLRRRQLYARRGTTDILRDRRKISVDEMVQHDGPGYVSHTAKGHDATGRTEIAVGAHSTEGLKGEKLAAAVSTSETRAGRRLTLKFCGLGILDYTEVTDPVEVKASPIELAAVAPAPIFTPSLPTPSAAPGKMVDPAERAQADTIAQAKAEADEISRKALAEAARQGVASLASVTPPPASAVAYIAPETVVEVTRRVAMPPALGAPYNLVPTTGLHGYAEAMKSAPPTEGPGEPAGYGISDPPKLAPATPVVPKQRRTRKKNTVDISAPGQVSASVETPAPTEKSPTADIPQSQPSQTCVDCGAHLNQHSFVNSALVCPSQANPAVPTQAFDAGGPPNVSPAVSHQPILAPPQSASTTDFPGKPSKEQETQYREQLREYSNVVLPGAGMVPSPGIGGPSAKLRIYAERMSGKMTQQMTTDDWDEFFEGMKSFRTLNGDKNLVKYINDVIGAK